MATKYIFVTGGVVSGIGKGIIASSIGRLLKNRGLTVFMQKFDPYINVNPGTMSPYQHGEVFVTKDGAETDLDLGHYERFIDVELTQNSSITTGRVYRSVIQKERDGFYNGATVQVIPHITDEIKHKIYAVGEESGADVVITEVGGTVGDIESLPFLEAIRQVHAEQDQENVILVHTTLIPKVPASDEYKTKPTQHSFKELMSLGIKANIIVTRCDEPLTEDMKNKIALFCDVNKQAIIESRNVGNLYEIPLAFEAQGLDSYILRKFNLELPKADMTEWKTMLENARNLEKEVNVALVGKYVELKDAYLSVTESLFHAGHQNRIDINMSWIQAEDINEATIADLLKDQDAIIVPAGSGEAGVEGMILTAHYAKQQDIPYFAIGMGMHTTLIAQARYDLGLEGANSAEVDSSSAHLIMVGNPEHDVDRLGNAPVKLEKTSTAFACYNEDVIMERHRNRLEFNNKYRSQFEESDMVFSGLSPDGQLVEIVEIPKAQFYVAVQYHPEFKSRPNNPHPLFEGFVKAALKYQEKRVK